MLVIVLEFLINKHVWVMSLPIQVNIVYCIVDEVVHSIVQPDVETQTYLCGYAATFLPRWPICLIWELVTLPGSKELDNPTIDIVLPIPLMALVIFNVSFPVMGALVTESVLRLC